jgi:hypothetical protein
MDKPSFSSGHKVAGSLTSDRFQEKKKSPAASRGFVFVMWTLLSKCGRYVDADFKNPFQSAI